MLIVRVEDKGAAQKFLNLINIIQVNNYKKTLLIYCLFRH